MSSIITNKAGLKTCAPCVNRFPKTLEGHLKRQPIMEDGSGEVGLYYTDTLFQQTWYFRGDNPNNFIQWGDIGGVPILWRIVKFDESGVLIIFEGLRKPDNTMPDENGIAYNSQWSPVSDNSWQNSVIRASLTDWFINTMEVERFNNQYVPVDWRCGAVVDNDPNTLEYFIENESENMEYSPWGLPHPSMLLMGSTNPVGFSYASDGSNAEACQDDADENYLASGNGKSGLIWTNHPLDGDSVSSWHYDQSQGRVYHSDTNNLYGIRPCVMLHPDISVDGGNGTLERPYTIDKSLQGKIQEHLRNHKIHCDCEKLWDELIALKNFVHLSDVRNYMSSTPQLAGLGVSVINSGNTFNFWGTGYLTNAANLSGTYYIVTSSEAPELAWYQSTATIGTLWIEQMGATTSYALRFDASGIYVTFQTAQTFTPGTSFKFTQALVLIPPTIPLLAHKAQLSLLGALH